MIRPLKKLENLAFLMTTKAFKSTSQEAIHILLDIFPLELHLETVSSFNALKLKKQEHWPHQSIDPTNRKTFQTSQQITDNTIDNYISPTDIINYTIQIGNRLKFNLPELTDNMIFVYTDESKQDDDRTRYGVYIIHESATYNEEFDRLKPFNTVFQSETYAIILTISPPFTHWCRHNPTNNTYMPRTDSITNLQWIPAHSEHVGNEKADELANKGARKDDGSSDNGPLIPLYFLYPHIKICVKTRKLQNWRYSENAQK